MPRVKLVPGLWGTLASPQPLSGEQIEAKARDLLQQLTLDETVAKVKDALGASPASAPQQARPASTLAAIQNQEDAPPCTTCGSIMVRSGACYKCVNCGTTSGCA